MSEMLPEHQIIVGVARHRNTGAYIVWVSLEGDDVTPVGAWNRETDAQDALRETSAAYQKMVEAMKAAELGEASEAGINSWGALLREMTARSDRETTLFPDGQLQEIGEGIAALLMRRQEAPEIPEGFARVLFYNDAALAGGAMPRVRLSPMRLPPNKGK